MVELVNNHVLFPHPANWKERPEWSRQWQNEISGAVTGAETRTATRVQPRVSLSFTITPSSLVEQAEFDDRIRAALKTGFGCAPYHGRAEILADNVGGDECRVIAGRNWAAGDYIFFRSPNDTHEIMQVEAANLAAGIWTLGLSNSFASVHLAGALVWPVLFGEFSVPGMAARSAVTGPARITIRELISPATATLGAVTPPVGAGIGVWKIGTTFAVQ